MRALVSGSSGFVGSYLCAHLRESGDTVLELHPDSDVTDEEELANEVARLGNFDMVYHLAALSHVGESWSNPSRTYEVNVIGTANLCHVVSRLSKKPKFLFISSSEVYGVPSQSELPILEDREKRPVTPYAASKAAAEEVVRQAYYGFDIPTVIIRAFNHTGPGQTPNFVVSGLSKRVAEALESRDNVGPIRVGNLSARRDFTDVRDVVRAYRLLALHGVAGQTYNVCSGRSVSIEQITQLLTQITDARVRFEVDPELVREVDVPEIYGSYKKLQEATGWSPKVDLAMTISEILNYWRSNL